MSHKPNNKTIAFIQNYSLPLIFGVIAALTFANLNHELYSKILHASVLPFVEGEKWQYYTSLHFIVNDIFMVFFFWCCG